MYGDWSSIPLTTMSESNTIVSTSHFRSSLTLSWSMCQGEIDLFKIN